MGIISFDIDYFQPDTENNLQTQTIAQILGGEETHPEDRPCRTLWVDILIRGLKDLLAVDTCTSRKCDIERFQQEAKNWFFGMRQARDFNMICSFIGVSPKAIRGIAWKALHDPLEQERVLKEIMGDKGYERAKRLRNGRIEAKARKDNQQRNNKD